MRIAPFTFEDHFQLEPPPTLFHYTSLEALLSIFAQGQLFASDARYLNDEREIVQTRAMLWHRCDYLLSQGNIPLRPALHFLRHYFRPQVTSPVYVASFSEKNDDLSQWRGYTPVNVGVCIGFRSAGLKQALLPLEREAEARVKAATLASVIYIDASEARSFDDLLISACEQMEVLEGEVVRASIVTKVFDVAIPFYKDSTFQDEAEWRICLSQFGHLDMRFPVFFRSGRSNLVPYSVIDFAARQVQVIQSVTIGPTPNAVLALEAMRRYLASIGLSDVHVSNSAVPYRPW